MKTFFDGVKIEGKKPYVVLRVLLTKREERTKEDGSLLVKFNIPINGQESNIKYLTGEEPMVSNDTVWAQAVFQDKEHAANASNILKLTEGKDKCWAYLTGTLDVKKVEKNGKTYTNTTVYVRKFDLVRGESNGSSSASAKENDDELPFEL